MTSEEKQSYGIREPSGYKKVKILGKGGCGIVFLCKNIINERLFAVKQISKKFKSDSSLHDCKKEIEILEQLGDSLYLGGIGKNYLVRLHEYIEDNHDLWLVFEIGGKSLGGLMFKIKGEFYNSERIYSIKKGKFYQHLFHNEINFKNFFKKLLLSIEFLSDSEIVHCDIKPDNILFDYEINSDLDDIINFDNMKLIDFGSAFRIDNPDNFSSNTPEYMPPEITELLERKASSKDIYTFLKNFVKYPYAIDIWSLGVMILEILVCCPVWMSYKAKTTINGKVSRVYLIIVCYFLLL